MEKQAEDLQKEKETALAEARTAGQQRASEQLEAAKAEQARVVAEKDSQIAVIQKKIDGLEQETERARGDVRVLKREAEARRVSGATKSKFAKLMDAYKELSDSRLSFAIMLERLASSAAIADRARPDVKVIMASADQAHDIAEMVEKMRENARRIATADSRELKEAGIDTVALLNTLAPEQATAVKKLVRAIEELSLSIKVRRSPITVEARNMEWVDSNVLASKGDAVYVETTGYWRIVGEWPRAGAEGWEGGQEYRITQNARAGALIMRFGASEQLHPAYLNEPIIADSSGTVFFRINDRDNRGNDGDIKAVPTAVNLEKVRAFLKVYRDTAAKVEWLQ